jgi:hypothetical protein
VGQGGEAPGAELAGGLDESDQPMLQVPALGRGRGTAERLEAPVDLDRVTGNRDRILTSLTQQVRRGDRDSGLPDPGRAEDREDLELRAFDGLPALLRQPGGFERLRHIRVRSNF